MTGCKTCGKPLSKVNRTGWCRAHYAIANNSVQAMRQNERQWSSAEFRARHAERTAARNAAKVAWCPLEYRADYERLKRVKHYTAAQARQMIEAQIAADTALYLRTGRLPQAERLAA
jgi:hypothetical protein